MHTRYIGIENPDVAEQVSFTANLTFAKDKLPEISSAGFGAHRGQFSENERKPLLLHILGQSMRGQLQREKEATKHCQRDCAGMLDWISVQSSEYPGAGGATFTRSRFLRTKSSRDNLLSQTIKMAS